LCAAHAAGGGRLRRHHPMATRAILGGGEELPQGWQAVRYRRPPRSREREPIQELSVSETCPGRHGEGTATIAAAERSSLVIGAARGTGAQARPTDGHADGDYQHCACLICAESADSELRRDRRAE